MANPVEYFMSRAPTYMALMIKDLDWSVLDAAAAMGNAGHESVGLTVYQEYKPKVPGSRGGASWWQWTGERRVAFEAYCKRNNLDPHSDIAAYKWFFVEVTTMWEKRVVPAVRDAKTLWDKVVTFERLYERAGHKAHQSRMVWAERALAAWEAADKPVETEPDPAAPTEQEIEGTALSVAAILREPHVKSVVVEYVRKGAYDIPQTLIPTKETSMLKTVLAPFDGYKAYMVAAAVLVCVFLEAGLGWDVPGFQVSDDWLGWVMSALGLGALRDAFNKK